MDQRPDLRNLTFQELTAFTRGIGLPDFRARQIFAWLYRPLVHEFSQMTDLSLELRERLSTVARISSLEVHREESSRDGSVKFAFLLPDQRLIETVLIPEGDRNTLCVSSQVGCAMGCAFCLTGGMGFVRNLSAGEIVGQVVAAADWLHRLNPERRLTNLVFMGMGEPLANLEELLRALNIIIDQRGLDFSERRVTVSTAGLIPKMLEFGRQSKVNLAISLHAADNETRDRLMPINRTYPLDDLLEACRHYPLPRRKRIMMEYILIRGVNDSVEAARMLTRKLAHIPCKINLLPYNENPSMPFRAPSPEQISLFQETLWKADYTVIVRNSRGGDISAACGQLAALADEEDEKPEGVSDTLD